MKKNIRIIVIAIIIILSIFLPVYAENEINEVKAKVVTDSILEDLTKENEPTKKVQNVKVRILEGEYENEEYDMQYVISEDAESITSNVELKEDDNIIVTIEENEGEVTDITYKQTINQNYTLYITGAILLIILFVVSRKRAIIIYLLTTIIIGVILIISMQNGWNLILVSSILSLLITMIMFISVNGMRKETLGMIVKAILGISVVGILIYILFDILKLSNINIKITQSFVNVKDLICSATVLSSCGIYNAIMVSAQYIFYANNKPYKTKSDNIIEGQRSLKL